MLARPARALPVLMLENEMHSAMNDMADKGGGLAELVPEPLDRALAMVLGETAETGIDARNRPWSVRKRQMLLFFVKKLQRVACDDRRIAVSVLHEIRCDGGFRCVEDLIESISSVNREIASLLFSRRKEGR